MSERILHVPKRVQRSRCRPMPEGAVYVGRPTKWGNPWVINETVRTATREACVLHYEIDLCWSMKNPWEAYEAGHYLLSPRDLFELRGHDLACWCPADAACHADVLLRYANLPLDEPVAWSARIRELNARLKALREGTAS